MMLTAALIATFVVTFMTGPAGREIVENWRTRREREQLPLATVSYLPSAACREDFARVEAVDVVDV